ncbi:hypothetical protein C0J52_23851 [Blattella germanica]|nr:hypothetical protein C0J52_23851 [Blattella germanica]
MDTLQLYLALVTHLFVLQQLLVSTAANIGAIASGMTVGFSAVALPAMQAISHEPRITDEQASWIASLTAFGSPAGSLFVGPLLDRLGRKRTMLLVNTPAVLGWLLISTSYQPIFMYQLFLGRFLTGLAAGLVGAPAVVYVSEVVDKSLRGVVVTWASIGVSFGTLLVYLLGALLQDNWRAVAGISACVPILAILAIWFLVPESPVWLASRGRVEEAERNMRFVRNLGQDDKLPEELQEELETMIHNNEERSKTNSDGWMDTLRYLKRPEAYKPLLIMNALFFFQQFSGIFVVMFYAVYFVQDTGVNFDGYLGSVMIGATRFVMSIVVSYASKSMGRRVLCHASGTGMTISMTALALYMGMSHDGVIEAAKWHWFPIVALVVYILTSTIGFMNLPFAMCGEVFPTRIRGSGVGFTTCNAAIFCFIVVKIFPEIRTSWGYQNIFTFFATISLIGTLVMYKFLPETQGKSLQEIEDSFKKAPKKTLQYVPEEPSSKDSNKKLLLVPDDVIIKK